MVSFPLRTLKAVHRSYFRRAIGYYGEQHAKEYCVRAGMWVIAQNWVYKNLEVDIIAIDSRTLVLVEVKTRIATHRENFPAYTAMNQRKQDALYEAEWMFTKRNAAFLRRHGIRKRRVDLIEVYYQLKYQFIPYPIEVRHRHNFQSCVS